MRGREREGEGGRKTARARVLVVIPPDSHKMTPLLRLSALKSKSGPFGIPSSPLSSISVQLSLLGLSSSLPPLPLPLPPPPTFFFNPDFMRLFGGLEQ